MSHLIPENEIQVSFARSGGAGGQNVNKTSTKVLVRWNVGYSLIFNDEEKWRIRKKLANKLNNNDELVVTAEDERSQAQNRALAVSKLRCFVTEALMVPKRRRATRPTRSSKERRLESKKRRSTVKVARSGRLF